MKRSAVALAGVVLAALGAACSSSNNDSHDSGRKDAPRATADAFTGTLGQLCKSSCNGTYCTAGGTSITQVCGTSSGLDMPCVGTSAGMYCTERCSSDSDCAPAARDMRCLTVCAQSPAAAGVCWATSSYNFMIQQVCGTASPDAPVIKQDAASDLAEARRDTGSDAFDAGRDGGDTGSDAFDAGRDGGETGADTSDAGRDGGSDMGADAAIDLGVDAGRESLNRDIIDSLFLLDSGVDTSPLDGGTIDGGASIDGGAG